MSTHLFVYGTLMSTAARAAIGKSERALLSKHGRLLGEASVPGRLYDKGRYPVLVAPECEGDRVSGELWALEAPDTVWLPLDRYEGIGPDQPKPHLYARVTLSATLAAEGQTIEAWTYVYNRPVNGLTRIAEGRWTPPAG
jgi:gamma-glutamylcyclotransferase (GGCT)/AIG2-like uncharacterized protein YtfP